MKFAAFLLLCASWSAQADWSQLASTEFSLKAPPAEGSSAYERDFEQLHEWEENRTEDDCALAGRQQHPTFQAFFGPQGGILTRAEFNRVKALLEESSEFTERVAGYFKNKYKRPRPYSTDTTLQPCAVKPSGSKSYPSSHAAIAVADACILAAIFPAKAEAIKDAGEHYADLRVIVGVHHPSDVAAGKKLGTDICERLLQEDDFRESLNNL